MQNESDNRHGSSILHGNWDCHHHKFLASNARQYFIVHDTSFNGSRIFYFFFFFFLFQTNPIYNELKINYKLNIIRNFFEESFFSPSANWNLAESLAIIRFISFSICLLCGWTYTKQFLHRTFVPYMKSR